jgi:1,4-dihydroxy-2-naphthoate octaprenyltransferase
MAINTGFRKTWWTRSVMLVLQQDRLWLQVFKHFYSVSGLLSFLTEHNSIIASDRFQLDFPGAFSISVIAAILATTIQAQDFQDVIGDKAVGRYTLPIAFPNFSRCTPLVTLVMWSLYLTAMWEITTPAGVGFTFLGIIVGIRYYFWRSTKDDEWSYVLYNVELFFFIFPQCPA